MPRILVIGSANVDIAVAVARLPGPGETVIGGTRLINYGGKGANQAVAARRLGAEVRFVGCVGDDAFGTAIRQQLAAEGLGIAGLTTIADVATGTALIMVDAAGGNQIAVASGANSHLTVDRVAPYTADFAWADVVVYQLEVPVETVLWSLRTARTHGVTTVLNPAPVQPLPAAVWPWVDYLTPNEVEARQLSSLAASTAQQVDAVAQALLALGPGVIMLTRGAQGVSVYSATGMVTVPAYPVAVVDTTAAGDAFNGALALAIAEGRELGDMVRFATAAAALTCMQPGAQDALPIRPQVDRFLNTSS